MKKLLLSTALSALLFSGAAFAEVPAEKGEHGAPPRMEEALSKLPKEKADLFRTTMKDLGTDRTASREQWQKLRGEMDAIMTAPKFDKAAFLAKSKEIASFQEARRAKFEQAIASIAGQYTQDERKILVDAMPHPGGHRGGHGGFHKPDAQPITPPPGDVKAE